MLQNHVTSKELSEKLKEAGVPQISEFYWFQNKISGEWHLVTERDGFIKTPSFTSAFLSSELGRLILYSTGSPLDSITTIPQMDGQMLCYFGSGNKEQCFYGDTEAEARGQILLYLLQQGLVKFTP